MNKTVGFKTDSDKADGIADLAAGVGMKVSPYLDRRITLDTSTEPPRLVLRELSPENVFVASPHETHFVGSLASVLRGAPDEQSPAAGDEIIPAKAAISAIMHHLSAGRIEYTYNLSQMVLSLRG